MSVLIKICGLKTSEALDVALAAGADLVGFVFFAPSPRHVGIETARALGARVRGRKRSRFRSTLAMTSWRRASRRSSPICCNFTARRRRSAW